ncbi:MAG: hypothetical protein KAT68_16405 [Bacteroidales bacterium]|nr:hypothetical protein [Bacteroidales bacterium]
MELRKSIKNRRVGVILTYVSLFSIVLIFEYCNVRQWTNILKMIEIISIVVLIVGFVFTYLKTGLWRFIHKPLKKLDEREIALTSKSLRYAYGIFTIIVLFLLLSFAIIGTALNVVLVVSLILFAHILPASIIAWTEKEV